MTLFYPSGHPDQYRYTPEGIALSNQICEAIRPILTAAVEAGASPREVEYLAAAEVRDVCLAQLLTMSGRITTINHRSGPGNSLGKLTP